MPDLFIFWSCASAPHGTLLIFFLFCIFLLLFFSRQEHEIQKKAQWNYHGSHVVRTKQNCTMTFVSLGYFRRFLDSVFCIRSEAICFFLCKVLMCDAVIVGVAVDPDRQALLTNKETM